jgi:3'-phosphoadenosine 5'-phosphosulfate sulfotransferase (PAPS reductase)/FAD synthetase
MFYDKIINDLKARTDEVVLFHSGTGKDSICLCDLMSKNFKRVVCVFMYIVKDLAYENRYINWAKNRYPNIEFYQTPHYALYSFIKHGYLGIKKDEKIECMTIAKMDRLIRVKFNISWTIYGFKKIDGVTRRVMLNGYKNGICESTKKAYPLMDLKNSEVLNYISDNNLIQPFNYGTTKPSSGCDISTPEFLAYMKNKYPDDLQRIFRVFPFTEAILFKYETYGKTN